MAVPEALFNGSGLSGQLVSGFSTYVTGSEFLTYALILLFLVLVAVVFRLPFDLVIIFIIPFVIVVSAVVGNGMTGIMVLLAIFGALLMARYIGVIFMNR
jgi:ABC-type Na+ efflux pump permease subunit